MTEPKHRPLQEAYDEISRELDLRRRCYPRWVPEGRLSATEAKDRLARLEAALAFLKQLGDLLPADDQTELVTSSGDTTEKPF